MFKYDTRSPRALGYSGPDGHSRSITTPYSTARLHRLLQNRRARMPDFLPSPGQPAFRAYTVPRRRRDSVTEAAEFRPIQSALSRVLIRREPPQAGEFRIGNEAESLRRGAHREDRSAGPDRACRAL